MPIFIPLICLVAMGLALFRRFIWLFPPGGVMAGALP
jgi:hypothetical protein